MASRWGSSNWGPPPIDHEAFAAAHNFADLAFSADDFHFSEQTETNACEFDDSEFRLAIDDAHVGTRKSGNSTRAAAPSRRRREHRMGLVVSDVAPVIGSDGSESGDDYVPHSCHAIDVGPVAQKAPQIPVNDSLSELVSHDEVRDVRCDESYPRHEMIDDQIDEDEMVVERRRRGIVMERLRACDEEEKRLREDYDAEVQRSADLRDELDSLELLETNFAEEQGPELERIRGMEEALRKAKLEEGRALMAMEDELGCLRRILCARSQEIRFLEQQLQDLEQQRQRVSREGPCTESELQEKLRDADKEMSELQVLVEDQDKAVHLASSDLESIIKYMMTTNIDAAGGPSPNIGSDDIFPQSVRGHLNLSTEGHRTIELLLKRFEQTMAEQGLRRLSDAQHAPTPGEPITPLLPAESYPEHAEGRLIENVGVWDYSAQEQQNATSEVVSGEDVMFSADAYAGFDAKPSANVGEQPESQAEKKVVEEEVVTPSKNFDDERSVLASGLQKELRFLTECLAGAMKTSHSMELLRLAALGDVEAVKKLLVVEQAPPPSSVANLKDTASSHTLLGWTAWHSAALRGHCSVLEALKDHAYQRGEHYLQPMEAQTAMGLPPLGVACLSGEVEAVQCLLRGMAPVDARVRDSRGNGPLLWAAMSGASDTLTPMLLQARADPDETNVSGQRAVDNVVMTSACPALVSSGRLPSGTLSESEHVVAENLPRGPTRGSAAEPTSQRGDSRSQTTGDVIATANCIDVKSVVAEDHREPYHCICALGSVDQGNAGSEMQSIGTFRIPVRDNVGFMQNICAKNTAMLSAEEASSGVWSEWVTNYTHAGLSCIGTSDFEPKNTCLNRQALVLTVERLLLFKVASWSLAQVVALSEISQLILSSYSTSLVVLRMHRLPDILLDVSPVTRSRLVDEVQLATQRVAAEWGGQDFGSGSSFFLNQEPLFALLNQKQTPIGTIAFIEPNIFLLLPYASNSALLAKGIPSFFGLLDAHMAAGGLWSWQRCLFMIRAEPDIGSLLLWCGHPCDDDCAGSVSIASIQKVQKLDTPQGDICLLLDHDDGALTVRAPSLERRDDWVRAFREAVRPVSATTRG
eukprot:TRINITY_DN62684_c0_g1_i1.p1 TRINITY_DN62684_c0_g1~~TRINITY_DN62684_c0_g1_i1.p1  ORF type:complete len:1095 (+),score=177.78 TRINITY_DN62684_c0_g1_i1:376-3660(+)